MCRTLYVLYAQGLKWFLRGARKARDGRGNSRARRHSLFL